ncbi:glycoside hydrolase family 3 N-terminal domain-containing protein [Streptococcus moroccensis]|uniref:Beta-glucosidase n=1 Tax=Streptococcus moroccensis TaxID=1451356 RepID=A0ABT9YU12_9STRE|nr:glycoside hydrolase family 3 N-terminal domain-containing protein [Streptococcus moroccensis]MDQ0222605.1 beta-glucosidase [Streptococcus moroccensis]
MDKYKNSSLPVEERVEDLLSKMTLEEKVAQLCGNLLPSVIDENGVVEENLAKNFYMGHGRFTQASTQGIQSATDMATRFNQIQKFFVEKTRLGIPVVFQTESLCGLPIQGGTIFPSQMNLGYTWEPELAEKMTTIISEECRSTGITSSMSPVIDVSRDLRWGRTYETYGEDEYLISQMGVSYINGMQKNKTDGVACIAKHFLGYSETQGGLNTSITRVNDRELYEVFATPFEAAANLADVSGMMANYSEIDGLNVVMNKKISQDLLRGTMKYRGFLTSDGAGIQRCYNTYHVANTYEEAGFLAKKAGTDTEIPVGGSFKALPKYVESGQLDESLIDESVRRILTVKFEYGLFESPYVDIESLKKSLNNEEKNKVAKEIASKSMVLLKNDDILPLKIDKKIAVIGPHADNLRYPISGYTYPAYIEMMLASEAGEVFTFGGIADANGEEGDASGAASQDVSSMNINDIIRRMGGSSLYDELQNRFETIYAEGCPIIAEDRSGFDAAVEAASQSDIVVFACGGNCGWTNATGGEGTDRAKLDLPGVQQELLEKLVATGKPVVMVIYGPGLFAIPWAKEHVSAILQASMPGLQAGEVVADVLDGTINPGGKLTQTIPRSVGQTPVYYNHRTGSGYELPTDKGYTGFAAAIFKGGYTDEDDQPLFEFGAGLSYTTFELSEFQVAEQEVSTDGEIKVSCKVTNIGERDGDEIVQIYYRTWGAHVIRPVQQLGGFKRVHLTKGQSCKIDFSIPCSLLGFYNEEMKFVVEPNKIELSVGTSSSNIAYRDEVQLTGQTLELMGKRSYSSKVEATF